MRVGIKKGNHGVCQAKGEAQMSGRVSVLVSYRIVSYRIVSYRIGAWEGQGQ